MDIPLHVVLVPTTAVVFLLSGVLKVYRPAAGSAFVNALPLPSWAASGALVRMLGFLEISLAIGAVAFPRGWSLIALLGLFILLVVFTAAVFWLLFRGTAVPCGCFGESNEAVSRTTVFRNALISSGLVLGMLSWPSDAAGSVISVALGEDPLTWAAILLAVVVVGAAVRPCPAQVVVAPSASAQPRAVLAGPVLNRADVVDAYGRTLTTAELYRGEPRVLVFARLSCGTCVPVIEHLAEVVARPGCAQLFGLVTSTSREELARIEPALALVGLYGPASAQAWFGVQGLPAAVRIGWGGRPEGAVMQGHEQVVRTIDQFVHERLGRSR